MKRLLWMTPVAIVLVLLATFVWQISENGGGSADEVEAALRKNATLLAGVGDPAALAAATCSTTSRSNQYRCVPRGVPDGQALRIVLRDGVLTKRFSGSQPQDDLKTVAQVAEALPIDATARGFPIGRVSCATSLRFSPDGTAEQGAASGMLCVQADRPDAGARYVELAPDGTVARDYPVASGTAEGDATTPAG